MSHQDMAAFTRRTFLGRGLTLASIAPTIPAFVGASGEALAALLAQTSSIPGVPDERVLVVVQLSGGNDGLNTVVPYGFDAYYKARPAIGIARNEALKLSGSDSVGLHPRLAGLKSLYDEGLCAVVQGVGYPNPNRSHFKSMDIWHTADTSATGDGWLGRYFDNECCGYGKGESGTPEAGAQEREGGQGAGAAKVEAGASAPGIAIGRTAPLAMQGRQVKPISFESAELFRWSGEDIHEALREPYAEINRRGASDEAKPGSNSAFLLRTALDAQVSSELIRKAVAQRSLVTYPQSGLAAQLAMVASMIRAGLKTKVYYVEHGGFDTHAGQGGAQGRHGNLLAQLGDALKAFYADLKAAGDDGRVLTMSFSEFGRRVSQNASGGTDHGTAAPMFLMGPMVRAGVLGDHPALTDLDEGDLKYKIDFRSVYAGVLEDWLKTDSKKVLEGTYRPVKAIKA